MLFARRQPPHKEPNADAADPGAGTGESAEDAVDSRLRQNARRERSLLSLLELSNELNVRSDLYEIADVALFNLLGQFGCSRGALWILPEDAGRDAVLLRCQGMGESAARAIGAVWTKWLLGRPGGLREPVLVSDLRDLETAPGLALAEDNGIALFAPVSARRKELGLVALGQRIGGGEFATPDREVLQASINFLGVALENSHMFNRAVESNRQLRLAYDQLHELDRLKSEFLRNMNHELRTPLTVMAAYLDSLLTTESEPGPRRDHLETVRGETEKLQGMLMNLLDFSKLVEDDLDLRSRPGDVTSLLQAFHEERRPGVTADLHELRYSAAADLPSAIFDPTRLLQIVDSLVENAMKFTPQGATIHLRIDRATVDEKLWVRVDVEDDGPGIPTDRLPHIFESFRQGDGSETRQHGGLGVGLAIARRLAEKMGGRLDVKTEIGRGTVFSLLLPT